VALKRVAEKVVGWWGRGMEAAGFCGPFAYLDVFLFL
jgi:hypothetical protein